MTGNILLMHMNEASGNINDFSGQGNNGTYDGSLYNQQGKLKSGLGFDGDNDYINVPLNQDLSSLSLEMWAKPNFPSNDNSKTLNRLFVIRSSTSTIAGLYNNLKQKFLLTERNNNSWSNTGDLLSVSVVNS
jgi:hypothetical protein